jgi:hypothetical protein
MDEPALSEDDADAHVTTSAVAANLRVLSIRLDKKQSASPAAGLSARVNQIIELFIDKHWRAPRRYNQIIPLSYLLFPGPYADSFAEDVEALTDQLERHLFGEGVEIKCLLGDASDIETLAAAPAEDFVDAHEASIEPPPEPEPQEEPGLEADEELAGQLRLFAGYEASKSAVLCYVTSLGLGDPAVLVAHHDISRTPGLRIETLEATALGFAAAKVMEQIKTGVVGYCLVPLSYETLADRRRREAYLKTSSALPEELRRFILPSIFGGPPQPSTNFLMEIVGALRQWYPNVDWQTRSCVFDPDPLKHAGLLSTTLVLPHGAQERKIEFARLPAFARRLGVLRLRTGVAGLVSRAEIDRAIAARVDYISGPAVSAEMPDLTPRIRLSLSALPLAA